MDIQSGTTSSNVSAGPMNLQLGPTNLPLKLSVQPLARGSPGSHSSEHAILHHLVTGRYRALYKDDVATYYVGTYDTLGEAFGAVSDHYDDTVTFREQ